MFRKVQAPEDADDSASDRAQRELVLWFVNLAREYFIKYPGKLPRFLDGSAEEKAEITMDILDAARDVGNPRERQANHEAISWGSRGPSPGRASNPSRSASSISPSVLRPRLVVVGTSAGEGFFGGPVRYVHDGSATRCAAWSLALLEAIGLAPGDLAVANAALDAVLLLAGNTDGDGSGAPRTSADQLASNESTVKNW